MGNKPNTPATPATAAKGATAAPKAPTAAALPPANVTPHSAGTTVVALPGTTYGVAVAHNGATVVLPWRLPSTATGPCTVTMAKLNANWLGRDGVRLCCATFYSVANPGMCVYLQPHKAGYKLCAHSGQNAVTRL